METVFPYGNEHGHLTARRVGFASFRLEVFQCQGAGDSSEGLVLPLWNRERPVN